MLTTHENHRKKVFTVSAKVKIRSEMIRNEAREMKVQT